MEKNLYQAANLLRHLDARNQIQVKESIEGQVQSVRYRNPPIHSQFSKGSVRKSRRPPQKLQGLCNDRAAELLERVASKENGREQTISKQEAILKQIVNKAFQGK